MIRYLELENRESPKLTFKHVNFEPLSLVNSQRSSAYVLILLCHLPCSNV